MPTPFEDFVTLELPKRPTMLSTANTGFDGDPNTGSPPAVISGAPQGSFYLRTTGDTLYKKNTSSPGSWGAVGGGGVATPSALTWNVMTTGNDATGDGSVGLPFLTTAGALTKLKSTYSSVEHLVDIVHGPGNFPGFLMAGVNIRQQTGTVPIGVRFLGTYVQATLTTGTTTGTITSRVSGTTTGPTGTGDTIGGAAPSMTLTDAGAAFSVGQVGLVVTITGATTPANNGTFRITGFTSATEITYQNPAGVAEAFTGTWLIPSVAWTAITDSAQAGWTVDELRGMHLRLLTGTGSPTMLPILSNTATSITFLSVSTTAGSIGGTFDIVVSASNFNSTVQIPPSVPFSGATVLAPQNAVIAIFNPTAASNIAQIIIEGIRIGPTTGLAGALGIFTSSTPVQIRRCFVGGTGTTPSARLSLNGFGNVGSTVTQCVIASPGVTNVTVVVAANLSQLTFTSNLCGLSTLATGYLPLRIAGQGVALGAHGSFSNISSLTFSGCVLHPLSFGLSISNCLATTISAVSWDMTGQNLSQPIIVSGNTILTMLAVLALGPNQSYGLQIAGPARAFITGLFGTGVENGIRMSSTGARVRIDPTTSIVGTRGDVLFADNQRIPFATLRSLVPKSIQDQHETLLYEV